MAGAKALRLEHLWGFREHKEATELEWNEQGLEMEVER